MEPSEEAGGRSVLQRLTDQSSGQRAGQEAEESQQGSFPQLCFQTLKSNLKFHVDFQTLVSVFKDKDFYLFNFFLVVEKEC